MTRGCTEQVSLVLTLPPRALGFVVRRLDREVVSGVGRTKNKEIRLCSSICEEVRGTGHEWTRGRWNVL